MTKKSIIAAGLALLSLGVVSVSQAQTPPPPPPPPPIQDKDVYETAVANEKLKSFSQLIDTAELKDTLKSKGDKEKGFTIFAPTEEAFAKLPPAVLEKLRADKALLKEVLQYHVVVGKSVVADLPAGATLKTSQGEPLTIKVEEGVTWVNGAKVTTADTKASNGYVHQIDVVLIPPTVAQKLGIGR